MTPSESVRAGPPDQTLSSRAHFFTGLLFLCISILSYPLVGYELWFEPVAVIVGLHYGILFIHGSDRWEGCGGGSFHYLAFGLWFVTLVLAGSFFMLQTSPVVVFSGTFSIGVGYLIGWLAYYR